MNMLDDDRKKYNLGGEGREQYVIGGIVRALSSKAKVKLRKELTKRYKSIVSKEDAEGMPRATTADDIIEEYEMGNDYIDYTTLNGTDSSIDKLEIEKILGKNLLESSQNYVKRKSKQEGGLLEDDREQYVLGGISKVISKAASKLKGKGSKSKSTQKELEDELRQLEYEMQGLMEENMNSPEGLVGARLDAVEEIQDLGDDIIKDLKKHYPDSKLLKEIERTNKAEGGSLLSDDMPMDTPMDMPIKEQETPMMPEVMPEMESDAEMEDNYLDFIIGEALSSEEEAMLMSKMEQDEELSMLFDKVIDVAQEFAGEGPVEGPGSGVSDSIPARLSDGEFVFTAKAVEEIGEDTLMSMMKEAEAKVDERQPLNLGGMPMMDEEMKMDQYGKPVDPDIVEDDIRKNMLDVNPRLR